MPRRIPVEGKYNIKSIYNFDLGTAEIGDTKDVNILVRKPTKGHVLLYTVCCIGHNKLNKIH